MPTTVLSQEWMQCYRELWNSNELTRDGLKELSMVIEYRLAEDETRAGQIEVVDGEVVRAGAPDGTKPDFVLTAKATDWKRLGDGELNAVPALVSRKVKFRGPMSVAMSHVSSFEAAMRMFGRVEDTDWAT